MKELHMNETQADKGLEYRYGTSREVHTQGGGDGGRAAVVGRTIVDSPGERCRVNKGGVPDKKCKGMGHQCSAG